MRCEMVLDDDFYTDWAMWRKSTHEVTLTYDKEDKSYYSTIRVAANGWDDFGDPRLLPDAITQKLREQVS